MKLNALGVVLSLGLTSTATFAVPYSYPQADAQVAAKSGLATNCEIEIVNNSYDTVRVFGFFDDNTSLKPFNVKWYDAPQFISLYYFGYCHAGMNLYIETETWHKYVYSGYTPTNTTLTINKTLGELKVESSAK